jgi:hypothetical protein
LTKTNVIAVAPSAEETYIDAEKKAADQFRRGNRQRNKSEVTHLQRESQVLSTTISGQLWSIKSRRAKPTAAPQSQLGLQFDPCGVVQANSTVNNAGKLS